MHDVDSLHNRDPALIATLARWLASTLIPYHRGEVHRLDRLPAGPALLVGNHSGFTYTPDSYILSHAIYERDGVEGLPHGLAHGYAIEHPILNGLMCRLGAVRACQENGMRLLDAGRRVLVYPGGDLDAMRPFYRRREVVFGGRSGFVELAARAGVPIVPVAAYGGHNTLLILDDLTWLVPRISKWATARRIKAWPLAITFPWGLGLTPPLGWMPFPAKIDVEILDPIHVPRTVANSLTEQRRVAESVRGSLEAAMRRLSDR